MARGFLLDVHISLAATAALRRAAPEAEIAHVARWRGGALRTAEDERILAAAADADLIFVTFDVRSVQPIASRWVAKGIAFPGVVFIVGAASSAGDVGGIARALGRLMRTPELLDPAYPVLYIRPGPN